VSRRSSRARCTPARGAAASARGSAAGVIAVLAAVACASLGGRPDWLDGTSREHPRERYLVGVGEGDDLDSAGTRARAEIARIFEVRIDDAVTDRMEGGGPADAPDSEQVTIETRTVASGVFEGIEIAATWTDPATRRSYALAVLDKQRAGLRLAREIAARDEEIASELRNAASAVDGLDECRALSRAARASRARDALAARARVVRTQGAPPIATGDPGSAALSRRLAAAMDDVRFVVSAHEVGLGDGRDRGDLPALRAGVSEILTGLGFRTEGDVAPSGRVDCHLGLRAVDRGRGGWIHYRWEGACDLSGSGTVVLTTSVSGSESHPVDATARTKALAVGGEALRSALDRDLRRYLYEE
jgi:hypothetical protein